MYKVEPNAGSPGQAIRRFLGREERPVDTQDESVEAFADEVMRTRGHPLAKRNPWLPPSDILFETRDEESECDRPDSSSGRQVMRQDEPEHGDPIGPLDWHKLLPFEPAPAITGTMCEFFSANRSQPAMNATKMAMPPSRAVGLWCQRSCRGGAIIPTRCVMYAPRGGTFRTNGGGDLRCRGHRAGPAHRRAGRR